MKILVTGGAGFIGSHLIENLLLKTSEIGIIDNLSGGSLENIETSLRNPGVKFIKGDLLSPKTIMEAMENAEVIYHLAANPEVRVSATNPEIHFEQNIKTTFNLLEVARKLGNPETLVFASTSTVYGEASKIPTPEDYAPLKPISIYGASKLACEALITAYAYTYGFRAVIYRLANIIGPRSTHGAIYDFIQKLKMNPKKLEVLGDGTQNKSYLYVKDCAEAMTFGLERSKRRVEVINIGSEDQVKVSKIARIVIDKMGLKNVDIEYTGGVNGGRGWIGDVKKMLLDVSKIKSKGWRPRYNSEQAVSLTVQNMIC